MNRTRLLLVGTVVAVALVFASPAAASMVSGQFSDEFAGDPGEENHVTITRTGGSLVITDTAGVTDDSPNCNPDNPQQVTCSLLFVHVALGDMNDELTATMPTRYGELVVSGGDGDDHIDLSGVGPDDGTNPNGLTLVGVRGDAGNDTMIGSQGPTEFDQLCVGFNPCFDFDLGDDTMIGGPSHDILHGGRGSDFLDGRDGVDTLEGTRLIYPDEPFPNRVDSAQDNAVDTIFCGTPNPAQAFDGDGVWAGAGDAVGIDCEQIQQSVLCPPTGALCDGTPLISTRTTTAATGSVAAAAGKRRRKVVLGRAPEKIKLKSGKSGTVFIELRRKRVRRAIGKRKRMTVTFSQNLDRIKKGRKVGEANRRKRFKIRKR
jgi:RTX calcium-binding nonapeptide repeat (4 copies)